MFQKIFNNTLNLIEFFSLSLYSQLSYCFYEMAPSASQTEHIMSTSVSVTTDPWSQQNQQQQQKENQRPPVFFPEDYIAALKKFSKFGSNNSSSSGGNSGNGNKSIYDTIEDVKNEKANGAINNNKSRTLPLSKNSDYK